MTWLRSLALAALATTTLAAETIHLKTRDLEPDADRQAYLSRPLKRRAAGSSHYLIQFDAPLSAKRFAELRERGITVTGYLPNSAVVVAAPDDFSLEGLPVRWVGRLEDRDKISPLIAPAGRLASRPRAYIVEFHADVAMDEGRALVREHGLRLIENPDLAPHHLLVKGWLGDLSRLASWDEVAYIFPASHELTTGARVYACAGAVVLQTTVAQFATVGPGWPVSSTNGLALGYVFSQLTEKLPPVTSQSEILRAFNEWAKYIMLSWVPGNDSQALRTVNILFARGYHGDGYPFDGPGKVLAHTFYPAPPNPEPIAGDLHLDDDERWQVGANIDLYSVVLHETGHALGLGHSDQPGDVMYPYYRLQTHLSDRDIATVRSLYPARDGSAPSQTVPNQPAPLPPPPAPLALTIVSPGASATTTASSIAISGATSGGTGAVRVTWATDSGYIGTATGTANWIISAVPLNFGANSVTIAASDTGGHIVTLRISVTRQQPPSAPPPSPAPAPSPTPAPPPPSPQPPSSPADKTPPSLLVTYPSSSIFSTNGTTITVKGLAGDNVGVTSVTWINSTGSAGTATGTTMWAAKDIPLLVGNNVITVKAFDAAGNYAWRSLIVVRQ